METNCENCKFWQGEIDIPSMGLCRRYAPRPGHRNPLEGPESIDCLWPRTKKDDYCGEWLAKVEIDNEK
ncbi:MAG: hypothetical protein JW882_14420 [Deltaproteobacteria bacterium]|nr:hypothetical protein [Deltaproteobacteria bacterium]